MKTIVAGSREFNDYNLVKQSLDECDISEIVSGCARGADTLGECYALEHSIKVTKFPADWNTYGKSAGYIRNEQMAAYGEQLVAFWDGKSKGTKHMIDLAVKKNLKVKVIIYE